MEEVEPRAQVRPGMNPETEKPNHGRLHLALVIQGLVLGTRLRATRVDAP